MWVCFNCHEFNDANKDKCVKCETPRQQREKPKGNREPTSNSQTTFKTTCTFIKF